MSGICEGRVVVVTGAGRGVGRGHALELAYQGAKVVVNDLGCEVDGTGSSPDPANDVVAEIKAMGGEAVANTADVGTSAGARSLVQDALDHFGRLDVLINNAGMLRDRVLANMTDEEWDAVMFGHLRTTYAPSHVAAQYWRDMAKGGNTHDARIISTSSASGLFGNPGQANYGAAKAGIAAFTIIAAKELARYGVTANAVAPAARTRMTAPLGMGAGHREGEFHWTDAENVAPLVTWLASTASAAVTGRVFEVMGGRIGVVEGWARGPHVDSKDRWDPAALGPVVTDLVERARPPEPMMPSDIG
jgi:NAD(P)-dependent dehydrogenase (short-subunit alcohol dehydrogenase family)